MKKNKPLSGRKIVITRAKKQAEEFVKRLHDMGAEVVEFPTIKIIPPSSYKELDEALKDFKKYHWIIFTSTNGVESFFKRFYKKGKDISEFKDKKIAVIGPSTAKEIEEKGLKIDLIPRRFKAEDVLEEFVKIDLKGVRILIPRAKVAREILPDTLRELGAHVDVVPVYETVPDDSKVDQVLKLLREDSIDMVTFTSSSTVKNFMRLLKGKIEPEKIKRLKIASIGPVTARTVLSSGMKNSIIAEDYTIPGLTEEIVKFFSGK